MRALTLAQKLRSEPTAEHIKANLHNKPPGNASGGFFIGKISIVAKVKPQRETSGAIATAK